MDLLVQIVRFVSHEPQPGVVACEFKDAENQTHTFIDKTAIFSTADLDSDSSYPSPGVVQCNVLAVWRDSEGRELNRIATRDGVESTQGMTEFVVMKDQLVGSDAV